MPPRRRRGERRELRLLLRRLGARPGPFMDLISKAVRNKWSTERFIMEVRVSKPFRRLFPGIPDYMSPGEYRQLEVQYRDVARDFGIKMNRRRVGMLMRGQVSAQEWYSRALIFNAVQTTDSFRQAFNETLRATGRQPLSPADYFKFMARKADAHLYDLWEATFLRTQPGIEIQAGEAVALARQIGAPGEMVQNLPELVRRVREIQDVAQPELRRAGITDADLLVLEAGGDPRGIAQTLQRIVTARQALGPTGAPPRRRTQLGLFPEAEEGL